MSEPLDVLKEMAFVNLAIHCEECKMDFQLSSDPVDPMDEWALFQAEAALADGWKVSDAGLVMCPLCVESSD